MSPRTAAAAALAAALALAPPPAAADGSFRIAWSIYAGWMPWGYIADSGIMDRWAEKHGIEVEIVQFNDYVESINQYTAGAFDGVTVTTMDALSIPAGGGVDTTALIVGDYSNGNDALIVKGGGTVADLAGQRVHLVELSVSHYLLARALDKAGLREADLAGVVNTSDADMIAAWATPEVRAVVTWNPLVAAIDAQPDSTVLFSSADIPGEIIDILAVNTETLAAHPELGRALVGAWYECLTLMRSGTPEGEAALSAMAAAAGTNLQGYKAQLAATRMFWTPAEAMAFVEDPALKTTMSGVAGFLYEKGILGVGAPGPDFVGIEYPDGTVTGDPGNVKLRFSTEFKALAADGAL